MTWRIAGTYVGGCSCKLLCACPVDGAPNHPDGGTECFGATMFHIAQGNSDETDLSGIAFAFYNYFPAKLSAGDWKVGFVVDEAASQEQAEALERILSGQQGGTFGDLAGLIGEYLGMERGSVAISDGDTPTATVAGMTEVRFEPLRGEDGTPTTVKNAAYGFAPEFRIGTAAGRSSAFGLGFEASYGEHAEFEYSNAGASEARGRA